MRGIEHVPWLYDVIMEVLDALGLGSWRRRLVDGAAGRTLEIGCGTGRNLPLYGCGVQVIGLDPDRAALIESAPARFDRATRRGDRRGASISRWSFRYRRQ